MSELTHETGDFYREVYARHSKPVTFMGITIYRDRAKQARVNAYAHRVADTSVRELRAAKASDKTVFEAFKSVSFSIEYRRPHLRAALADAYRAGDHAELGRIVAEEMRLELQDQAEESACEEIGDYEEEQA